MQEHDLSVINRKKSIKMDAREENNNIKNSAANAEQSEQLPKKESAQSPREIGGPKGLEPTRYGDWEKKGRCIDF